MIHEIPSSIINYLFTYYKRGAANVKPGIKMTKATTRIIMDLWIIFGLKFLFIASIVSHDIAVTVISCYCCLISCVC
jgi:hypothetical protein